MKEGGEGTFEADGELMKKKLRAPAASARFDGPNRV